MAVCTDEVPAAVEQLTNYFTYMYPCLSKSLHDARRCSERFKSGYQEWRQIRFKNLKELSAVTNLLFSKNCNDLYEKAILQFRLLSESLRVDIKTFENLLSVFNEYLNHASEIKRSFDEAKANNVTGIVVSIVKAELPGQVESIIGIPTEELNLQEIVPLLKMINTWSLGKIDSVDGIIEILNYLSCQWSIIEELNKINENRGPVCDINLFPDKFLEDSILLGKQMSYYDIVSNLSVGSLAQSVLKSLMDLQEEEFLSDAEINCMKISKIMQAMENRTKKAEYLTELLIAET